MKHIKEEICSILDGFTNSYDLYTEKKAARGLFSTNLLLRNSDIEAEDVLKALNIGLPNLDIRLEGRFINFYPNEFAAPPSAYEKESVDAFIDDRRLSRMLFVRDALRLKVTKSEGIHLFNIHMEEMYRNLALKEGFELFLTKFNNLDQTHSYQQFESTELSSLLLLIESAIDNA